MRTGISRWVFPAALVCLAACGRHSPDAAVDESVTVRGDTVVFHRRPGGELRDQEKEFVIAKVDSLHTAIRHFPGRIIWNEDRTVRVSSPFGGRVVRISAQVGDRVAAGAPLLTLASPDIGGAQSDAAKAEAEFVLAEKSLRRARDLQAAGVVAARDVEQSEAELASVRAERERTRHRLAPYGVATIVDGQFVVRSPIAGVVVERAANPGQEVRPDQAAPLYVVSDTASLWLQVDLPEDKAAETRVGEEIAVRRTNDAVVRTARVVSVADAVDPLTRTLHTRAVLPNADRALKAEQFVSVDANTTANPVPVVPATAVFLTGDRQFVWITDGRGTYSRREVTPAGVAADELVVARGGLFLQQLASNAADESRGE